MTQSTSARIVLAGGGTTGHIAPMIATAEALSRMDDGADLLCIGTAKGLETRLVPAAGLRLELVPPVPLPRKPTVDLARVPGRLLGSVRRAGEILDAHRAQAVVGFGGYVSMPAYLAAKRRGIPVVIHEGNAVPGLANKVAARFARRVLTSFPNSPLPRAEQVGLPVRRELTELATAGRESRRAAARAQFGLDPERATLLVTGGSQGARSINNATLAARDELLAAGVQILHIWGPKNFTDELTVVRDQGTGAAYHPVGYVDGMENAYAACNLMVSRSGAGTVFEAAIMALPAIFVPLPHGNGEQARNAADLVAAGGGALVPDGELDGPRLAREVLARITNPEALTTMGAVGPTMFDADAADAVARIVLDCARDARKREGEDHVA
ncbi:MULTISPECIES: undecaprenyldiphospho-muramoylpentapeptide beta-N-acetylglucosaminyltransferase [unclassified Luteococcus]|uniref:undecaprenyldiphospho-muramoylpentapeptide beta-N-acetylglucosaminyltransferase n=1 Tax=unclassified Luteococcus TaxID=2639923 RepID=UPI00313DE0FD